MKKLMFTAICLLGTVVLMSNTIAPEEKMEEEYLCSEWIGVNIGSSNGFWLCGDHYASNADLNAAVEFQLSLR